jgi:hypothetical protein
VSCGGLGWAGVRSRIRSMAGRGRRPVPGVPVAGCYWPVRPV